MIGHQGGTMVTQPQSSHNGLRFQWMIYWWVLGHINPTGPRLPFPPRNMVRVHVRAPGVALH